MPSIDVCLSPELLHLHELPGKVVVAVDILRATSSIVTAFAHGIKKVIPVSHLEECRAYSDLGCLTAAEREGRKAEGFDLGNSPFSYMHQHIAGRILAITTTNGTRAIRLSAAADAVVVGSFLNIGGVAGFIEAQQKDVIVVCAGWKGNFNLEDTLFAGALSGRLLEAGFVAANDATLAARHLYEVARPDMLAFLSASSHVQRLKNLNITKDIEYCLQEDLYEVVPVLQDNYLVLAEVAQAADQTK